ncbi:MAG: MgtC/SapB family protein [Bradymonadaceae bacterium]
MDAQITLDWQLIQTVATSLALGAIIGLERQSHQTEGEPEGMGMRTFALASLLGTMAILVQDISPALPWLAGIGFLLLIVTFFVSEIRSLDRLTGITTQVAALLVFVLGAMVPSQPLLATSTAVIIALILSIKRYTHKYVGLLNQTEVFDTLKLLLVTVVLLPLLPNQPIDPWGIYNPRELWFLVVLISAISFVGYFLMRFFGPKRGIIATGTVGGLASSTAVTLAMSERARQSTGIERILIAAAFAILIANTIMVARVSVEIAVVNPSLLAHLWMPLGALFLSGLVGAALLWRKLSKQDDSEEDQSDEDQSDEDQSDEDKLDDAETTDATRERLRLQNPFRLGPALKFGLIFLLIIGLVHLAREELGSRGLLLAAFVSGLADVDAIALAVARMEQADTVAADMAARAIALAIVSNSLVKIAIAGFFGSRRLAMLVTLGMAPVLIVGVIITLLI